eukprot:IDg15461t1
MNAFMGAPSPCLATSFHNACVTQRGERRPIRHTVHITRRLPLTSVAAGYSGRAQEPPSAAAAGSGGNSPDDVAWETIDGCPTALPTGRAPTGIVHMIGGLGACAAPERFYSRLVRGVCKKADVAVICVPLPAVPGLNHSAIAKQARIRAQRVLRILRDQYGSTLRSAAMGHSLGARLQVVSACEGDIADAGIVLMSFANAEGRAAVAGADAVRDALQGGAATAAGDALRRAGALAADALMGAGAGRADAVSAS